MRFLQLTSETRLTVRHAGECEEAILEVTGQKRAVLLVVNRFSLRVQQALYALDDLVATAHEELEKFDVRLERHLAETRSGRPLFRRGERMKSQASKQLAAPIVRRRSVTVQV